MQRNVDIFTSSLVWHAWKRACAADLCSPEEAAVLRRFGAARFALLARRAGFRHDEVRDPWHLLEVHSQVGRTRAGKRYKDWLFARTQSEGDDWVRAVEAGATLLLRSAVREYVRRERAPRFVVSMDQPVEISGVTLAELLPAPSDGVECLDAAQLDGWARMIADRLFDKIDKVEKVLLWARMQGVPFSDGRVTRRTRLGVSVMYHRFQKLVSRMHAVVDASFPVEHSSVRAELVIRALVEMGARSAAALFSDKPTMAVLS